MALFIFKKKTRKIWKIIMIYFSVKFVCNQDQELLQNFTRDLLPVLSDFYIYISNRFLKIVWNLKIQLKYAKADIQIIFDNLNRIQANNSDFVFSLDLII